MDILVQKLILFLVIFTIIYLGYYIFVIRNYGKETKNKKNKKKEQERIEIQFLEQKYKLNMKNIDKNKLLWDIAFANSLIMSTTVVLMGLDFLKEYVWKLLFGVAILVPLIIITYSILGKKYKKVGK